MLNPRKLNPRSQGRAGSIHYYMDQEEADASPARPSRRKRRASTRATTLSTDQLPWCINTGKSLIPLTLLFLHQKRNLLIPLELSRVMHQGNRMMGVGAKRAIGLYRSCAPRQCTPGSVAPRCRCSIPSQTTSRRSSPRQSPVPSRARRPFPARGVPHHLSGQPCAPPAKSSQNVPARGS